MERRRLLGPPLMAYIVGGAAVAWVAYAATSIDALGAFSAIVALVIAWRAFGVGAYIDGAEFVTRNFLSTKRFPIGEVDIRPEVVDTREDLVWVPPPTDLEGVPTLDDDTSVGVAKRYMLFHGDSKYFIGALMGRFPANHERLALTMRREVIAARDDP